MRLSEAEKPAVLRKAHDTVLKGLIKQGEAALREREAAVSASGQTSSRIGGLRDDCNQALLHIEGVLKQLAAKRRTGPDWGNSFFPEPTRAPRKNPPRSRAARTLVVPRQR